MKISIATRLKPFSHEPGTKVILPGTSFQFEVFPALIRVYDLSTLFPKLLTEVELSIEGPVKDFTVQLDLEKVCIRVFGKASNGYFRYRLEAPISLTLEKGSPTFTWKGNKIFSDPPSLPKSQNNERLSLGCHKAQDWTLVKRRLDLAEILPFWFRLGSLTPAFSAEGGVAEFLKNAEFQHLFQAGFEGILSPRLTDEGHQGFRLSSPKEGSPLALLAKGAHLIRELFIKQEGKKVFFLPKLYPEFHCGRFLNLALPNCGVVHMEWSKKLIKKLIFKAAEDCSLSFYFQKAIKSCRLRESLQDKGRKLACPTSLEFTKGKTYLFDRFQK